MDLYIINLKNEYEEIKKIKNLKIKEINIEDLFYVDKFNKIPNKKVNIVIDVLESNI